MPCLVIEICGQIIKVKFEFYNKVNLIQGDQIG
jgi:hypothetical protein